MFIYDCQSYFKIVQFKLLFLGSCIAKTLNLYDFPQSPVKYRGFSGSMASPDVVQVKLWTPSTPLRQLVTLSPLHLFIYVSADIKAGIYRRDLQGCPFLREGAKFPITVFFIWTAPAKRISRLVTKNSFRTPPFIKYIHRILRCMDIKINLVGSQYKK